MAEKNVKQVPVVDFAVLGEEYYVTDYIQVDNPRLQEVAAKLKGKTAMETVRKVNRYVARKLTYPMDRRGRPNASRHVKVFKYWNGLYHCDTGEKHYGWLLPNQTLKIKYGICFDSSCLATTLLRILGLEAYTVLGAVFKTRTGKLLSFHAWTEVAVDGEKYVLETTVHPKPAPIVKAQLLYNGKFPVTYDPIAWFNESEWREDAEKAARYEAMIYGK